MLEALGKEGIRTLEDFAQCADWELAGGYTTVNGQRVKDNGILEPFGVSLEEAQTMVMTARVMLGWVDPTELDAGADAADAETDAEDKA
jgi:N utilization substance protein A